MNSKHSNSNPSNHYAAITSMIALVITLIIIWMFATGKGLHHSCCQHPAKATKRHINAAEQKPNFTATKTFSFSASANTFSSNGDSRNIGWLNNTQALQEMLNDGISIEGNEQTVILKGMVSSEVKKLQKNLDAEVFFGPNVIIDNQIRIGTNPADEADVSKVATDKISASTALFFKYG
ncbi:MAG: hypothetical protein P8Q15_06005 [Methylophilaceae bacterium]|nr:hypothetical protein [Methylophilaceae bacterium]